jgi:hypothetical protein
MLLREPQEYTSAETGEIDLQMLTSLRKARPHRAKVSLAVLQLRSSEFCHDPQQEISCAVVSA